MRGALESVTLGGSWSGFSFVSGRGYTIMLYCRSISSCCFHRGMSA